MGKIECVLVDISRPGSQQTTTAQSPSCSRASDQRRHRTASSPAVCPRQTAGRCCEPLPRWVQRQTWGRGWIHKPWLWLRCVSWGVSWVSGISGWVLIDIIYIADYTTYNKQGPPCSCWLTRPTELYLIGVIVPNHPWAPVWLPLLGNEVVSPSDGRFEKLSWIINWFVDSDCSLRNLLYTIYMYSYTANAISTSIMS